MHMMPIVLHTYRFALSFLGYFLLLHPAGAQSPREKAIEDFLPALLQKHREFVSLPNVASDSAGIYQNLEWVTREFENRSFAVQWLESSTLPVFLAERKSPGAQKTLLLYFHLDGQPVDASRWDQEDPFGPVLKAKDEYGNWQTIPWERAKGNINPEWRIFGRAAADDKAPIMMFLKALDLLASENQEISSNLKVILDCQEEVGSEAFLSTLEKYKKKYTADYMLILDGPAHPSNRPTLTFGCRGIATCSITVYGAKLPQHSGHFGNYAPNPVFTLSHLLASMKDSTGRVSIAGYYEGIELDAGTKAILDAVPDDEQSIRESLLIHQADRVAQTYQSALQYPSLNVRHIETSWKGPGLKTVIPEFVKAHLDVRLVSETDGARQLEKIRQHIQKQGFYVLDREPKDEERLRYTRIATFQGKPGVNAFRTDLQEPFVRKLADALKIEFGEPPVKIRSMGGTVPIIEAVKTLGIPAIILPLVNMDNNQHNPNENIRIGNIIQGIRVCATLLGLSW